MQKIILDTQALDLQTLRSISEHPALLEITSSSLERVQQSAEVVQQVIKSGKTVYGINTGFGLLASTRIATDQLSQLQYSLVVSHAAGTGDPLPDAVVRLIMLLKLNSLIQGYSGIQVSTLNALVTLFNQQIYPLIPAKGSVGASGDLAPLAHLSAALLGIGQVRHQGKTIAAAEGLQLANLKPVSLGPKEGLALLNGTQVSAALALSALFDCETLFRSTVVIGALTIDAAAATRSAFDPRIQQVRGQQAQIDVASAYRKILQESEIGLQHLDCDKVQDPYSIRCQPQVMGACLAHMRFACQQLLAEANAVTDNPLIFTDTQEIISGGNFHAQPVAMAADTLALAIAEIGALSERRTSLLVDPNLSQLPAFLVQNPGVNSGFMIAHVTAAALASENKSLAHPACVDSLPTSANQEDHVSMATFAARRLHEMLDNSFGIIAIELLAAGQGIDFRRPMKTSKILEKVQALLRQQVPYYKQDRFMANDIAAAKKLIKSGALSALCSDDVKLL